MNTNKHKEIGFNNISDKIHNFLDERDRLVTKNDSRSVAISISLEANELLEHFQWNEKTSSSKKELSDELADVLIYCFQFADIFDIDIPTAIIKKLKEQEKKYPAELFKGKNSNVSDDAWVKAKISYNKQKDTL